MTMTDTAADHLGKEIARHANEFAPRRRRNDRPQSVVAETVEPEPTKADILSPLPATQDIAEAATRFHVMVSNLQHERAALERQSAEQAARIEQFQISITDLQSQLETARLETSEANRRTDAVREHVTRLRAMIENIGGLISDALQE